MSAKLRDLTPIVDLTRSSSVGPIRSQRPAFKDLLPPCNAACPAGENIQAWMALVQAGELRQAWNVLLRDNPMPAVHGRVCYHPCETKCNREELDSTVNIHAIERFLGDQAISEGWPLSIDVPATGKRVLIIGAGPSGLSAAYHLTRLGNTVEIHDAGPQPGGMLHYGIPQYRLPREILMQEIERIEKIGVKIFLNHKIDDVLAEKQAGDFDAVYIAIGANISKRVDIPARDAGHVLDAVSLLHDANTEPANLLGRRVIVYGGGNTAMDAARTAERLGALDTVIVYRRDQTHMGARPFEATEALAEGVRIKWLSTIKGIEGTDVAVELMTIDAHGFPQPTGKFETLQADVVVLALGQESDSEFLKKIPAIILKSDGSMIVGANMMTGEPGIFGGGDVVPGERSVTVATGQGKKAASCIDAWLRHSESIKPAKHAVVEFNMLKLVIYNDAVVARQNEVAVSERIHSFEEVISGLTEMQAVREAKRCLSCGNCFECDNCLAACPETAITKLGVGLGYEVNFERCTGCAVCYEQCPCHAIEMVPESTNRVPQHPA